MNEYWIGTNVMGFDGTVLEVFGMTDVQRFHIYQLHGFLLSAKSFSIIGPGRGTPSLRLESEQDRGVANAVVSAVNEARAARGWAPLGTG